MHRLFSENQISSKQLINHVNFIWMGNISSTNRKICSSIGPISLAMVDHDIPIHVWVRTYALDQAKLLFGKYKNISVYSVDAMLAGQYGDLNYIAQYVANIQKILDWPLPESMNSALLYTNQKDLMSIVVIAEYGGHFFDTTTRFYEKPKFDKMTEFKITLPTNCRNPSREQLDKKELFLPFIATDIWSFASSRAGHEFFLKNLSNVDFNVDLNNDPINVNFFRVLEETYGEIPKDISLLEKLSWEVVNSSVVASEHDEPLRVPELGMEKINSGAWREPKEDVYSDDAVKQLQLVNKEDSSFDVVKHIEENVRNRQLYFQKQKISNKNE